jgi:cytochrome bd-type quinol oxidase subunit 2
MTYNGDNMKPFLLIAELFDSIFVVIIETLQEMDDEHLDCSIFKETKFLLLIPFSIIIVLFSLFLSKKKNKNISYAMLVFGILIFLGSVLLLTGIYDPYANHIR